MAYSGIVEQARWAGWASSSFRPRRVTLEYPKMLAPCSCSPRKSVRDRARHTWGTVQAEPGCYPPGLGLVFSVIFLVSCVFCSAEVDTVSGLRKRLCHAA